jgi:predicted metal-binding integral membrane protein DUF2182
MVSERASQQTLFGVSALLLVASAALTTAWCGSMSAVGEMPMPGGWTMSMAWVRMPGQTWPGAAASFLRMWVVMMVAMMLPSLVPALWRYRQARRDARQQALALADRAGGPGVLPSVGRVRNRGLSAGYRIGGHRDATTNAGANRSDRDRCGGSNRRRSPVHRVESASACALPRGAGTRTHASGGCRHCLATWAAPRHHCSYACAGLTSTLLVVGVMDLRVMALATAGITAERLAPNGKHVARAIGAIVVVAGMFLTATATAGL